MRSRWFSRRALLLHLVIAIWVPGCLVAGWWQVTVALSGNGLSYLYSVEWPVFAIFGMIAWWHAIHDEPDTVGSAALRRTQQSRSTSSAPSSDSMPVDARGEGIVRRREDEDEDLAAYNDYLAELARRDRPKTWRRS